MDNTTQSSYWDRVAHSKTFTHPLNVALLEKYITHSGKIIDYGCGYGRIVAHLTSLGYADVTGFDTSEELIKRGREHPTLPVFHIAQLNDLPVGDNEADCILLFAVLTCIPGNAAQTELMHFLHTKLKPGGIIYISDYYLQADLAEVGKYEYYNGDADNFGTFTLPEGATFRHHTREWINSLLRNFDIKEEYKTEVRTMNGSNASAFQIIAQKR